MPEAEVGGAALVGGRLSHFRLLDLLGTGGMGLVYRAEDLTLGRIVAIKVLRPELVRDRSAVKRFLREAKSAAGLVHPNVVTIYEADQEGDRLFVAMELVEGASLAAILRGAALPIEATLSVARDVAQALAAAHARSMAHRDVKPSNIVIEARTGRAKLLDFGLAKVLGGGGEERTSAILTAPAQLVGTPAYMSPEQAWGEPVDSRTDVFSAGVVLHELVAGANPFKRDTGL
ncbi:MAG: serine/threonine protein kinase, partial [Sandaracinaceae bacterium]|nr:serine/threonine protein kinase [Sandaracinaceae bacterium]